MVREIRSEDFESIAEFLSEFSDQKFSIENCSLINGKFLINNSMIFFEDESNPKTITFL